MTLDDVRAYPHQIADALWRIEAAGIPRGAGAGGVEVCGVAYGAGELAAAMLGDRGPASEEPLVLCVSYSGEDEEALACFEGAGRRGAPRAVVCTAGRLATRARAEGVPVIGVPAGIEDPRGAIVYFVLAAAIIADPSLQGDMEAAVPTLARLAEAPAEAQAQSGSRAERVLADLLLRDMREAS